MNVWTWGIDFNLSSIDVVAVHDDAPPRCITITTGMGDQAPVEAKLYSLQEGADLELPLLARTAPPFSVWPEQPVASKQNIRMIWAFGALMPALYRALMTAAPYPIPVWPVMQQSWRKQVIGRGDAKKPDVVDWVRSNGPEGCHTWSEDRMEAYCIALHGEHMTREVRND
jgi:hypothetical protein